MYNQNLYHKTIGAGPNLYLLHGFGLNSAVFEPLAPYLSQHFTLHLLDLPGCARSKNIKTEQINIDSICDLLANKITENSTILAWSLSGLLAINLANRMPNIIKKLILVSTTPNFTTNNNWQAGIDTKQFNNFEYNFLNNTAQTIDDFITLQLRGSSLEEAKKKHLKHSLQIHKTEKNVLKKYLAILANTNLISEFKHLTQPILAIYGKYDKMIPYKHHQQILNLRTDINYHLMPRAAHAPHLTNPATFCNTVLNFYDQHN